MLSSEVAEDVCVSLSHSDEGGAMDLINFEEGVGVDIGKLCPYEGGVGMDSDGGDGEGFGVVLSQSAYKTLKDGRKVKRAITWKCECAGFPDTRRRVGGKRLSKELEGESVATKNSKKCGCEAGMYAGLKDHGLCDFAEKYVAVMEQHIQSKRLADANSVVYLRGLVTDFKIEEMYRNLYIDAKFIEIQRECKRMMYCNGSSMRDISYGYFEHLIVDRVYVWIRYYKMMVVFAPISNLASDNDETMMMVIEGLKELEMKVKKKTTPALPMSSVRETGFKSTLPSMNNTRRALTFETPSSVGKSGVEGVVVHSREQVHQLGHQDIVFGSIKDPRSKRGEGIIRCTRFMMTFKEVTRQKELRKKKYEEKKGS
uniref:Uncharacterized protein n=1 Tax=Chenopodium quinoa TaxID=63459 RepID=A0A803MTE8_CHEQI